MDSSHEPRKPEPVAPDRLNRVRYALYAPIYDRLVGVFNRHAGKRLKPSVSVRGNTY